MAADSLPATKAGIVPQRLPYLGRESRPAISFPSLTHRLGAGNLRAIFRAKVVSLKCSAPYNLSGSQKTERPSPFAFAQRQLLQTLYVWRDFDAPRCAPDVLGNHCSTPVRTDQGDDVNMNAAQALTTVFHGSFLRPLAIAGPRILRIGARCDW